MTTLKASDTVARGMRGELKQSELRSTYFDTPDFRLAGLGVSLRIRRDGEELIQTAKLETKPQGAVKDRLEWEVRLSDHTPDLRIFADQDLFDHVGLVLPEELQPVFETRVERERALLDWQGRDGSSVIEIAFDRGAVVAGHRRAAINELELELKEGAPSAIYEMVAELQSSAPLMVETATKAQRGYVLLGANPLGPRKASPLDLDPDATIEEGMMAILRASLAHLLDNEHAAWLGRDPEGVHQMRVALRRLRSALSIFKPVLGESEWRRWNDEFRWLIGRLGPARDLDVFQADVLDPIEIDAEGDKWLQALDELAADARARAYGRVRTTLKGDRYARLVLDFALWIELQQWRNALDDAAKEQLEKPLGPYAHAMLEKRHRQLLKRGRHFSHLDAAARHEVRKTLKKLRYGIDYFGSFFDSHRVKLFSKKLSSFQDELGHLNDVAVAAGLVEMLVAKAPADHNARMGAGIVIGWHAAAAVRHREDAAANWRAFKDMTPFW